MFTKQAAQCPEITANDGCMLKEVLHPRNDALDHPYSLALARLAPGGRTHAHFLRHQTETYHLLSGSARLHAGGEQAELAAGGVAVVPPGTVQWIENTGAGELRFAVIVHPPWQAEDDSRI